MPQFESFYTVPVRPSTNCFPTVRFPVGSIGPFFVVYFDQQTHACACICMVENDEKHLKSWKKYLFMCTRGSCETHEEKQLRLTWASCGLDGKGTFSMIFKRFSMFSTMQRHAQACICRLKYTTILIRFCFGAITSPLVKITSLLVLSKNHKRNFQDSCYSIFEGGVNMFK